jgi:hypothetical protein
VVGTTNGTQTDFDGNYSITAVVGKKLRFSYIGQKTTDKTVGTSNTINVQMQEDAETLDEVIVTAFGTSTKEAFTGSAVVIGADQLGLRNVTSPIAAIEGRATGVQFTTGSSGP